MVWSRLFLLSATLESGCRNSKEDDFAYFLELISNSNRLLHDFLRNVPTWKDSQCHDTAIEIRTISRSYIVQLAIVKPYQITVCGDIEKYTHKEIAKFSYQNQIWLHWPRKNSNSCRNNFCTLQTGIVYSTFSITLLLCVVEYGGKYKQSMWVIFFSCKSYIRCLAKTYTKHGR